MCKPKAPKPVITAQAPDPAERSAEVVQSDPANLDAEADGNRAKRKGRSSLRIPLSVGGTGGGSGLNIPTG